MTQRLLLIPITGFWLVMNLLLWRAEFGGGKLQGNPIPPERVWERILTAPDDSSLAIVHHGRRAGFCRWAPNVGEELAMGKISTDQTTPEGMVKRVTGYTLDLDGNLKLEIDATNRVRFSLHSSFGTNRLWKSGALKVSYRPTHWELDASALTRQVKVEFQTDAGITLWERSIAFDEFRNPRKLLQDVAGPLGAIWAAALPPLPGADAPAGAAHPAATLDWEARTGWLKVGHAEARVYRLRARLLDKYEIRVLVSHVGEILKIELPDGIVLANEAIFQVPP